MEEFRQAYGFEGIYEISNHGNIRRCKPGQGTRYMRNFRLPAHGYHEIGLRREGKTVRTSIHRLVAHTFIRPIMAHECVNHLDGNVANNRLENLEITTPAGNARHAIDKLGWKPTVQRGEQNGNSKITEEQARFIKHAVVKRGDVIRIATEWGVKPSTLYSVRANRTWKNS